MADDAASQEDVLKSIIGQPTGKSKVIVERGPVEHFADALLSTSPIYHNPEAARQAGFANIPAPPTWPFAMEFSGKFAEMQPTDAPPGNPLFTAIGPLMAKGGLILHGEQEFLYHRPVEVGDVLDRRRFHHRRLPEGVQGADDDLHLLGDRIGATRRRASRW